MANKMADVAVELAVSLISAATFGHAVATADIQSAVRNMKTTQHSYPQSQLEKQVASEIRKRYQPGVSGSL